MGFCVALYWRFEQKKDQGGRADRTFGEETISPPKTAERIGEQFGVSHLLHTTGDRGGGGGE
jgi:hypothetical protein